MTKYKGKIKWQGIEPKVCRLTRKLVPPIFFKGLKRIIFTDKTTYLKKDEISAYWPSFRCIILNKNRLRKEIGDYNNDKIMRRILESYALAHEIIHNWQFNQKMIYPGLYIANQRYRNKIEEETEKTIKKLVRDFG